MSAYDDWKTTEPDCGVDEPPEHHWTCSCPECFVDHPETVERLLRLTVETRGLPAQADQAVEELAELIVALRHWQRGRPGAIVQVAEELADVQIMLDQLRLGFGPEFAAEVDAVRSAKLSRLAVRLGAEP